jgi:hypothetical protein
MDIKTVTLPPPPPLKNKGNTDIVKIIGDTQMPREFITGGVEYLEAISRTIFKDQNQMNDNLLYKLQLDEFDMADEVNNSALLILNGYPSINGKARDQALFGHIGIIPSNYKDANGRKMRMDPNNPSQQGTISKNNQNNKEF